MREEGLPTDSFEIAGLWREIHATKRMPTNPRQIAKQLAEREDDEVPKSQTCRRKFLKRRGEGDASRSDEAMPGGVFHGFFLC
ncbi:MAG: hypothetical protein DME49_13510 [Verrucomicrobia bacterium]|nr:MAG: hypothetical protein DME49_13510 [Verrucomicrobiota bacterium]